MTCGAEKLPGSASVPAWLGLWAALCMATFLPASSDAPGQTESPTNPHSPKVEPYIVTGITAPNRQATVATLQQGRIQFLPVEEGQSVEVDEPLIILDDRVQAVKTEFQRIESESTLDIEVSRARMEQARAEYERMMRLNGDDFASSKELDDARADAIVKRLEHQIAMMEHEQAIRLYEREKLLLEQHHVPAPFSGYVSEHLKHVGETVEEREGVLTLVQLDPLEVILDCPVTLGPHIRPGGEVRVRPVQERFGARWGTVVLANQVADPASQTFRVKLTVDNADHGWISGLKVKVEFFSVEEGQAAGPGTGSGGQQVVAVSGSRPASSTEEQARGD